MTCQRTKHLHVRSREHVRSRGGHRGVVTKLIREAEEIITAATGPLDAPGRNRVNAIKQQLEGKLKTLEELNKEILASCDPTVIVTEIEESDAIVTKVISCKLKIDELIAVTSSASFTSSETTVASPVNPLTHSKPRLPKLTLPKFNGDVTKWTTFWDSFKSAIDPQLAPIDKFNYLNSLLEGNALRCVKGLQLSEDNYNTALDLLKQRFGKKQQIICAHMEELVKLSDCNNDRPHSLCSLYDHITVHIRGLEALEVNSDQYGSLLIPIIMSKLPSEVRLKVARENQEDVWQIKDLMKVLQTEVDAREASETTKLKSASQTAAKNHSQNRHNHTAGAFVSQNRPIKCVYCNALHYSASCDKVRDVKERKDHLIKTGRCFNCLKANHKTRECLSTKTCRLCHQKHHQSICNSLSQQVEPFVPSSLPPVSLPTDGSVATSNNTSSNKNAKTVLLQTARAVAYNHDTGSSSRVRILFDSGSQRSYVTEQLCSRLKLRPVSTERLQVNTFGGEHFKAKSCKLYRIDLSKPGVHECHSITAIGYPTICSTLPSVTAVGEYTHLSDLKLADFSGGPDTAAIDLLIGSDFYWQFVTGEVRRGSAGPVAIHSTLGWLLSGSINPTQVTAAIDLLIGSDFYWQFVTGEVRRGSAGPVAIHSTLGWLLSGSINPTQVSGEHFKAKSCKLYRIDLSKPGVHECHSITAIGYPTICSTLPSVTAVGEYTHLSDLELADFSGGPDTAAIDLLIGSDFYWQFVTGEVRRGSAGPVAIHSTLGWLLSGSINPTQVSGDTCTHLILATSNVTSIPEVQDPVQDMLRKFWDTESIGIVDTEQEMTNEFSNHIQFHENYYEVSLPWKEGHCDLPNHFSLSLNRLRHLQHKLLRNPDLLTEYNRIIEEQLQKGIIEQVNAPIPGQFEKYTLNKRGESVHYLPHHAVIHRERATTKIRIVYDGSAKLNESEPSLNECLQTGPNLIPKLFDVLLRFRAHPIAITADIEKAFLMIGVAPKDRDVLRFLWFQDPYKLDSPIRQFHFTRVVFGLRPSPALLGAVILHHLDKYSSIEPQLIEGIKKGLYVDDLITGSDSVASAFQIYTRAKQIMSEGGLNLRKWTTNSPDLLKRIRQAEEAHAGNNGSTLTSVSEEEQTYAQSHTGLMNPTESQPHNKLLGVLWDSKSDELLVDLSELVRYAHSLPMTKRSVLRVSAKIFDPLGLLSPFVVKLKLLFRNLCSENVNWDDPVEGEILNKWKSLIQEFESLGQTRCYFDSSRVPILFELHGFSDASSQAYGAVVYFRTVYDDGSVSSTLVSSKTRVAPVKHQTIPRLELLGALMLTKLVLTVKKSLDSLLSLNCYYWTDSTVVLFWIRNHKPWKQYVSHRVNEIRRHSLSEEWNHCPGSVNPADMPSRGLKGSELCDSQHWWIGPEFLCKPQSEWPNTTSLSSVEEANLKLIKEVPVISHSLVVLSTQFRLHDVIDCERFSSLLKLLNTTAYVFRFTRLLRNQIRSNASSRVSGCLSPTAEEITESESYWIKSIQGDSFSAEIKHLATDRPSECVPLVKQFALFLDGGILRCRGRLNNSTLPLNAKNPILLPHNHPFVTLLIQQYHERSRHSGVNDTLTLLRENYWILKGKRIVKQVISRCVTCLKCEGLPYHVTTTPDLPAERVSDDPPFTHIGIDFAGPLYIKDKSSNQTKVYVCLFTCCSTRAVHLELTELLSAESFLLAFRRFVGRRGLPSTIWSDNVKTFKTAAKEIQKLIRSPEVIKHLASSHITWKFIVERAPWWGGFWERMIRLVKRSLKKCIGRASLTHDELSTLLVEVESVVNSRPLTYVFDDSEGINYSLSPSHLIYGRKVANIPNIGHFEIVSTSESLSRRAKRHQTLLRHFTNQWRRQYLLSLREAHSTASRSSAVKSVEVGDVVILRDELTKRAFWRLGIVTELLTGVDDTTRAAIVKTVNSDRTQFLRRSIKHLIPVELNTNLDAVNDSSVSTTDEEQHGSTSSSTQSRRRAAASRGEKQRRLNTSN